MRRAVAAALFAVTACSPASPLAHPTPRGSGSAVASSDASGAPSTAPSASASASVAPIASSVPKDDVPEPATIEVAPEVQTVLDAYDRLAEDKAQDAGRRPGMTLTFFGLTTGQSVAEIVPGEGYFIELLARTVGPTGKVYGVNNKMVLEKSGDKWQKRLERAFNKNVVRLDRELDAPFPAEVNDLDAVVILQSYHDLYWLGVDRAALNKAIFAALKPGGIYGVVDHLARSGSGASQVKTLHRIEGSEVKKDVEAAGFVLDGEATFLRNPRDTKDWSSNDSGHGTTDRFVYRFKKPR
jgi:predicted methyltransferase